MTDRKIVERIVLTRSTQINSLKNPMKLCGHCECTIDLGMLSLLFGIIFHTEQKKDVNIVRSMVDSMLLHCKHECESNYSIVYSTLGSVHRQRYIIFFLSFYYK